MIRFSSIECKLYSRQLMTIYLCMGLIFPVYAQNEKELSLQEQRVEVNKLKAMQMELAERIIALEKVLEALDQSATNSSNIRETIAQSPPVLTSSELIVNAKSSPLKVSGDFMLRHERNYSSPDSENRNRSVLRARLKASYSISNTLSVGAMLETGDSDDPNSGYLTISNFADDFQLSLSQAYLHFNLDSLQIYAGKFPQPLTKTDMVWDGDVNPQGVASVYSDHLSETSSTKATGIYFIVDENASGSDSDMLGGQLTFKKELFKGLKTQWSIGYYDYRIESLVGADSGDIRSNLLNENGEYLSDFNLLDLILSGTYLGLAESWPVNFSFNYVKNNAAAVSADSGYSFDLKLGHASKKGDWRVTYGYSEVEVDAVFAAFSNDNISLATNYQTNKLSLDFIATDDVKLNATWYHYRPLDALYSNSFDPAQWLNRIRLNLSTSF